PMAKRGPLASDTAMTDQIIREAETTDRPFFFFAVSLQNHGPYEPRRYGTSTTHSASSPIGEWARASLESYAEGVSDADRELKRLIDWAQARERPTVIALFGDHLPPLGPVYVETGFLNDNVAPRRGPPDQMRLHRETPMVIWSNRDGLVKEQGSVSPAFLPYHVLKVAGITHPYYTGFLGDLRQQFSVVDRHMLLKADGNAVADWLRQKEVEPLLRNFRYLQYDMMFGKKFGASDFFPETA